MSYRIEHGRLIFLDSDVPDFNVIGRKADYFHLDKEDISCGKENLKMDKMRDAVGRINQDLGTNFNPYTVMRQNYQRMDRDRNESYQQLVKQGGDQIVPEGQNDGFFTNHPQLKKTMIGVSIAIGISLVITYIIAGSTQTKTTTAHNVLNFNNNVADTYEYNKDVDDHLKFIIANITLELRQTCDTTDDVSWSTLESILNQCTGLRKDDNPDVNKIETKDLKDLKSTDKIAELKEWIHDIVQRTDKDILSVMRTNDVDFERVMTDSLNEMSYGFLGFFWSKKRYENDVIDIGFIRFPTKKKPFVKLYRIRVVYLYNLTQFFGIGDMTKQVGVEINTRKYYPNDKVIDTFPSTSMINIITRFENMITNSQ
jgi:hypothetical protein